MTQSRKTRTTCPLCQKKGALSVMVTENGKTLVNCFYGCSQDSQAELWRVFGGARLPTLHHEPKTNPRLANESAKAFALELWRSSLSGRDGFVPIYLGSRGLVGHVPESIRFLPKHLHKPTGTLWPVALAKVTDAAGMFQAVQRIYLAVDGKGKAPIEPAKMTLGAVGSFAVHLATAGAKLAISEGIETGLSVQQSTGIPTWAAISAGGMRQLILPPMPLASEVIIAADNDPVGIRSAQDAAARWQREGRTVRIALPPSDQDFNDVLQGATI